VEQKAYPVRKKRVDAKKNVNPALTHDDHDKLVMLAISCNKSKTKMAEMLLSMCLNHPDIINYFQNIYNKNPNLRITTIKENGKITYAYVHR